MILATFQVPGSTQYITGLFSAGTSRTRIKELFKQELLLDARQTRKPQQDVADEIKALNDSDILIISVFKDGRVYTGREGVNSFPHH